MSVNSVGAAAARTSGHLEAALAGERYPPARDGEAPSDEQLAVLFEAATAVPDHGALHPVRFVVVTGSGRRRLAGALAADMAAAAGRSPDEVAARAEKKAFAAPMLVAVIATPDTRASVPAWEQIASATLSAYAIVLAGQMLGIGAVLKTPAVRSGAGLGELFGLSGDEELLGWVLVGSRDPAAVRRERRPVATGDVVTTIA